MPDGPSGTLDSTAVLIQRVREGDKDSLERLMQRHVAPLRRYVSGRLPRWARDLADTDDLVAAARRFDARWFSGSSLRQESHPH